MSKDSLEKALAEMTGKAGCLGYLIGLPIVIAIVIMFIAQSDIFQYIKQDIFKIGISKEEKEDMTNEEKQKVDKTHLCTGCGAGCGCLIVVMIFILFLLFLKDLLFNDWLSTI